MLVQISAYFDQKKCEDNLSINIPSTVYVCRQTLPVLCLPRSNWNAPAVYRKCRNQETKKLRNQETKKPRNKQRHSMKFKRPCLQHWPNYHLACTMGTTFSNSYMTLISLRYKRNLENILHEVAEVKWFSWTLDIPCKYTSLFDFGQNHGVVDFPILLRYKCHWTKVPCSIFCVHISTWLSNYKLMHSDSLIDYRWQHE